MNQEAAQILNQGVQMKRERRYVEAVSLYMQAIELAPTEAICYYSLAKTYYLINQWELSVLNYLRSKHQELRETWKKYIADPHFSQLANTVRETTSQDTLTFLDAIHPIAFFMLLDSNTSNHLGHALLDANWQNSESNQEIQNILIKFRKKLPEHINHYHRSLAGESISSDKNDMDIEEQVYVPIGKEFILRNLHWRKLDSSDDVREIYRNFNGKSDMAVT